MTVSFHDAGGADLPSRITVIKRTPFITSLVPIDAYPVNISSVWAVSGGHSLDTYTSADVDMSLSQALSTTRFAGAVFAQK